MFKKFWNLYQKYQEPINYLVVGGIGTLVSIVSFALLLNLMSTVAANIVSWIVVVILMYVLNRYFVFSEHAKGFAAIAREIVSFVMARVATLLLETFIVWLGIDMMKLNAIAIKTFAQILVIVLNYFFSKFFIFKDSKKGNNKADAVRDNSRKR